ncbi:maleylpyruvate isomerase family mycothiol-dependent enzyme [Nocardioides daeguensis]|uniref:Maleylpyruvate isomerase family mycothiol-dependent enzyme n=1 Tax=Nocardioides daeguensis TaxID=908359 RepID=A0ABP6W5W4_9ACTN|nr:maleylpyruvate isomerase family mycothiol-dependent enzyme [Nocardioides daeguensis]MBV6727626.1 maleylpyruvate isomerase family mycothiol-dependent enzyme [Nocardioides daeguensis]MCR1775098.1 maleylpyruvate isomerase family mycothiol-dependent enzyme [Nocardioides daeguensis]
MEWIDLLERTTGELADVLATGDLAAAVPACPGWTLAGLGEHTRWVHAWATHAVTERSPDGDTPAPGRQRDVLVAGYRDAAARLLDVLRATAPDTPVWTFGADTRAGFWRRRQVHEVTMHLYDALDSQARAGEWQPSAELGWDGVDEVATLFYPRQVRLGRTEPLAAPVRLVATDLDRALVLEPAAAGDPVELAAPANELLLMLWGRLPATGPAADVLARAQITS